MSCTSSPSRGRQSSLLALVRMLVLLILLVRIVYLDALGATTHPIYQRKKPIPQDWHRFNSDVWHIDLNPVHGVAYPTNAGELSQYVTNFDARAASIIATGTDLNGLITEYLCPNHGCDRRGLLEFKEYHEDPNIWVTTSKCLAVMAFQDYFPTEPGTTANPTSGLYDAVSHALLDASPGWAGTFGPDAEGGWDVLTEKSSGDYDMNEMFLIPLAYRYYDQLSPQAAEYLITQLIARGRIRRPDESDTFTSGGAPVDWSRAGYVSPLGAHKSIDETENHILMIQTARYLANQLLYTRDRTFVYDNRRNGQNGAPAVTDLILSLLRNILRDDFSEYNAKNYQEETRWALLNLATYAYDEEVRLAARMVLDYLAGHMVVSSCDLKRFVPFRRRIEFPKMSALPAPLHSVLNMGLLDQPLGADPMPVYYALQAGHLRCYQYPNLRLNPDNSLPMRPSVWAVSDGGQEVMLEALSDYRLPPTIHDLFVNDLHRRFYQRLHRVIRPEEAGGNRNADNMEVFAASPSYLISAGGEPATWAIDPVYLGVPRAEPEKQVGVAVSTTFIPTAAGAGLAVQNAEDLIQFVSIPYETDPIPTVEIKNYGVAPDFACGYGLYLPPWVTAAAEQVGPYLFVNKGPTAPKPDGELAGFYLAIHQDGRLGFLEAFDTWLNPNVTYEQFKAGVLAANPNPQLIDDTETTYRTQTGHEIKFKVWGTTRKIGGDISHITYSSSDPLSSLGDAGNNRAPFLSGTIMNSPAEAVVEIRNPLLGTKIVLDLSDKWHPRRTDETGRVEEGGGNHVVWVDFDSPGPESGDFFQPFKTMQAAAKAVADGGVIKILPGTTTETFINHRTTGVRVETPIGDVHTGLSIFNQPQDTNAIPCGTADFQVEAYGAGTLKYQWRMDGVPLTDDGSFFGVHSNHLHIEHILYDYERTFDVVISDDTGPEKAITSDPVYLQLPTPPWVEVEMKPSPLHQQWKRNPDWVSAYDEHRGVVVLYGGDNERSQPSNSLWEYDGETWKPIQDAYTDQVTSLGQPLYPGNVLPVEYAMVYNPDDHLTYLIGDWTEDYPMMISTWDGSHWALAYEGPVKGGQRHYHAIYDRQNHKISIIRSRYSGDNYSELLVYDPLTHSIVRQDPMQPPLERAVTKVFWVYDEYRKLTYWYQDDFVQFSPRSLWALDENYVWKRLEGVPGLPRTDYPLAGYNPVRRRLSNFGIIAGPIPYITSMYAFPAHPDSVFPSATDWTMELPDGPPRNPAGEGISPNNALFPQSFTFDRRRKSWVLLGLQGGNPSGGLPYPAWACYESRYRDAVVFDKDLVVKSTTDNAAQFTVRATGFGKLNYVWWHNGQPVVNGRFGASPLGGVVNGADSPLMTITGLGSTDYGDYYVQVSNDCGPVKSVPVRLAKAGETSLMTPILEQGSLRIRAIGPLAGQLTLESAQTISGPWTREETVDVNINGVADFGQKTPSAKARFFRVVTGSSSSK